MSGQPLSAVVIGAGPYGLSVASHLRRLGVDCRIFGASMAGWTQHMPRGMFLKSTALDSDIGAPTDGYTLADYCAESGIEGSAARRADWIVPLDAFVGYGRWFQRQLVPHLEEVRVRSVERVGDLYSVELETDERVTTRNVVLALGATPFKSIPNELKAGARNGRSERITHTSEHSDLSCFGGRRVAVIGSGQSALETAVLLDEAGAAVRLIARRAAIVWGEAPVTDPNLCQRILKPPSRLSAGWPHLLVTRFASCYRYLPAALRLRELRTLLGPAGAWWLRERFSGSIDLDLRCQVVRAVEHADCVELELRRPDAPPQRITADHVISGTGYRLDVARLGMLSPEIATSIASVGGYPALSTTSESSVPGLFFAGLAAAATFGPMLRFVTGSGFLARRVCAGIVSRAETSSLSCGTKKVPARPVTIRS